MTPTRILPDLQCSLLCEEVRQEANGNFFLLGIIDVAFQRKQYDDAERLIADGTKRYPSYDGWTDLSRHLADARRTAPAQTGNAPPAPPTAPRN